MCVLTSSCVHLHVYNWKKSCLVFNVHDNNLPLCFSVEVDTNINSISVVLSTVMWFVGFTAVWSVFFSTETHFPVLLQELLCLSVQRVTDTLFCCDGFFSCSFPSFGTVGCFLVTIPSTEGFTNFSVNSCVALIKKYFLVLLLFCLGGRERGWCNGSPSLLLLLLFTSVQISV